MSKIEQQTINKILYHIYTFLKLKRVKTMTVQQMGKGREMDRGSDNSTG